MSSLLLVLFVLLVLDLVVVLLLILDLVPALLLVLVLLPAPELLLVLLVELDPGFSASKSYIGSLLILVYC